MSEPVRSLPATLTLQEFLTWNDGTDTRYELVEGRPAAMAPPSRAHSTIALSVGSLLRAQLRPPCVAGSEWGIPRAGSQESYWQADVAVACGQTAPDAPLPDPVLIVEVVSPSSIEHDRGRKVPAYREIAACRCILLVWSTHRRVERWLRDDQRWIVTDHIGDGEVTIEPLGLTLDIATIYEGSGI